MVDINNPAGRLYILLDKFRKHNDKTHIGDAWADVFGIDKNNIGEMLYTISEVVKLVDETQQLILLQDVDRDLHMRPFIEIPKMFTLSFGHTLANARNSVSDTVMYGLEHCDDVLSRVVKEELIDQATLDDLLSNVNTLSDEIYESDLPSELKSSIMDNLNNISWAIRHYQIHGAKGLKVAAEGAFGSIALYYARKDSEKPSEGEKNLVKNYLSLSYKVMSIVADAYAVAQLMDGAVDAILPFLQ